MICCNWNRETLSSVVPICFSCKSKAKKHPGVLSAGQQSHSAQSARCHFTVHGTQLFPFHGGLLYRRWGKPERKSSECDWLNSPGAAALLLPRGSTHAFDPALKKRAALQLATREIQSRWIPIGSSRDQTKKLLCVGIQLRGQEFNATFAVELVSIFYSSDCAMWAQIGQKMGGKEKIPRKYGNMYRKSLRISCGSFNFDKKIYY
jgi:hypothetical protein